MRDSQKPDIDAGEGSRWNAWGPEEPLPMDGNQFQAFMEQSIRDYLQSFSRKELRKKIRDFKAINFKKLSYREIEDAVGTVLAMGNPPYGPVFSIDVPKYLKGMKFYRVRKFSNGKSPVSTLPDCWYPPPEDTKMGRVNLAGKPILYTSPDRLTAAEEMGVMDGCPGSSFIMLEYTAKKLGFFGLITCGTTSVDSALNEEELGKLEMLRDFLFDEFTREVGIGIEYLYRITNVIVENYFNYPDSSGYSYPSIAKKEGSWNTSFFPEQAKANLELTGIDHWRLRDIRKPERVARFRISDNGLDVIRWE